VAKKHLGKTEPRLWTRPLRELRPAEYDADGHEVRAATSLGFEVIEFAFEVLGVELYPWQKWLLIHALEVLANGQYRFRRVIVLVGRQNGKTTLASVLAAWWLFIDSARHPKRVPPLKFKIVGVAQNLDIAREPWAAVKMWCDPDPETSEEAELAVHALQDATAKVYDVNGNLTIIARSRAHYEIRAAKNARGKPAARVLMDEMREQKDWAAWNAVSQTSKSFFNGMLIGFSNAGDPGAVVLRKQRGVAMEDLRDSGLPYDEDAIEKGIEQLEALANGDDVELEEDEIEADVSLGLFEWSAEPGCRKDDVEQILQSNPSIGYGSMTVGTCLADIRGMTDAGYRTEVLCQWVSATVVSHINVKDWRKTYVDPADLRIPKGARTVWAVDTSSDRSMTWIAAAVRTEAGEPFVTVRVARPGMVWVVDYLKQLAEESKQTEVVLQLRGAPAMEFHDPLTTAGLTVHALEGGKFAIATGRMADRVRDEELLTVEQPDVETAVEGGVTTSFGENKAWSREKSEPIDISGLVAESMALYGLEVLAPPPRKPAPPPPPRAGVVRGESASIDANLATVAF
jgi:phage terminase large subunit-like protein